MGNFHRGAVPRMGSSVGVEGNVGASHLATNGGTGDTDGKDRRLGAEHRTGGFLGSLNLGDGGELPLDVGDDVEIDVCLIVSPTGDEDETLDEFLSVTVDDVFHSQ